MALLARKRLLVIAGRTAHSYSTPARPCRIICTAPAPARRLPVTAVACPQHLQAWIRRLHESALKAESSESNSVVVERPVVRRLPLQCTGCGAFAQTTVPGEAGYFDLDRRSVRDYLGLFQPREEEEAEREEREDMVVQETLQRLSPEELERLGLLPKDLFAGRSHRVTQPEASVEKEPPVCERCHSLRHHGKGVPIYHPTVSALREIIAESPHKYNHIYHLVDAADFPLSLVPRLHQAIGDVYLRSQNRRSRRGGRFYRDRVMEMSFVITRSDLLAPQKEMVDSLLPYLREVLRKALGSTGQRLRLGNVKLVSADRGWWTPPLREEIHKKGGAAWMVGKVNVGKSKLFETVFPKGHLDSKRPELQGKGMGGLGALTPAADGSSRASREAAGSPEPTTSGTNPAIEEVEELDLESLLPPPRPETNYPVMPTVASLPGTTASPIRVPFGRGKGEVIDLPGLARSDLEHYVLEKHRQSLIMKHRIAPKQIIIKPDQSLLLGGFIRITPKTPDLIFLAANFTPLQDHVTGTEKAIAIQKQETTLRVDNISLPGTGQKVKSAGSFALMHDITRLRAGPLSRKDSLGLNPSKLPFRVLAVDILIEGVGWVEISAQVRTRDYPHDTPQLQRERIGEDDAIPLRTTETIEALRKADAGREVAAAAGKRSGGEAETKATDPWAGLIEASIGRQNKSPARPKLELEPNEVALKVEEKEADEQKARPLWPLVEVFTPEGRFVGCRACMNGYMLNKAKVEKVRKLRRSKKGEKKRAKMLRRQQATTRNGAVA